MNKYTEAIQGDDLSQVMKAHPTRVTAAGVALLQQEIERLQATPLPADAALADALKDYQEALGLLFIDGSSVTIPSGSTAHKQLRLIVEAARLRALSQPATVAQVPEPINAVYFDVPAQPKSAYVMGWNDCIESMLSAAPSAKGG